MATSSSAHLTSIPVAVVAGCGKNGSENSTKFCCPLGICADSEGAMIVADTANHRICKITSGGIESTIAGNQGTRGHRDGGCTQALFSSPVGVCVGEDGTIYVSEFHNHRIRRISCDGIVSTLAGSGLIGFVDGTSTHAQFNHPWGIAVDEDNNVYVADSDNHSIRKVTPCGSVTTLGGCGYAGFQDGDASMAMFSSPVGVCVSSLSGNVFVTDARNNRIRRIDIVSGQVFTYAGADNSGFQDGAGVNATFDLPHGIAMDTQGAIIVVERSHSQRIRKISTDRVVKTLLGKRSQRNLQSTAALPRSVAIDVSGNVYEANGNTHRVRKIQGTYLRREDKRRSSASGNGTPSSSHFSSNPNSRSNSELKPNSESKPTPVICIQGTSTSGDFNRENVSAVQINANAKVHTMNVEQSESNTNSTCKQPQKHTHVCKGLHPILTLIQPPPDVPYTHALPQPIFR